MYCIVLTNQQSSNKVMRLLLFLILIFGCLSSTDQLTPLQPILIYLNTSNGNITIYQNNTLNSTFQFPFAPFNCSRTPIYSYMQTPQQYTNNTPYYMVIINQSQLFYTLSTAHNIIQPSATLQPYNGQYSVLEIYNNCPNPLRTFAYFDRIIIEIDPIPYVINYHVVCSTDFHFKDTFNWGMLILIIICAILITFTALLSRAWSIGGQGIKVNPYIIVTFNLCIIFGFIMAYFELKILKIIVDILSFAVGIFGVSLCCNQLLFLFQFAFFKANLKVWKLSIRVMDIISLIVGIGMSIAWWYSGYNWILNDLLSISFIIAAIKILKFTNLKMPILYFIITIIVELTFVFLIVFGLNASYGSLVIDDINSPIELQLPTINPVYNRTCAWFPTTAVIYPGLILSYLRRFDSSRNTWVYFIIGVITFLIGSMFWMMITLLSPIDWPFIMITGPLTITSIVIYAYKRSQIQTLWNGYFFDEQFAHRNSLSVIKKSLEQQRTNSNMSNLKSEYLRGLEIQSKQGNSSMAFSSPSKISKFSFSLYRK